MKPRFLTPAAYGAAVVLLIAALATGLNALGLAAMPFVVLAAVSATTPCRPAGRSLNPSIHNPEFTP